MHKILTRQLAKASTPSGDIDLQALLRSVSDAYEQSDSDRIRTDHSISLMIEELDQLNRDLDRQVRERTRALAEREAELQAQNLRFLTAIGNMPHGLSMFDAEERLIVCNDRYLAMYGLKPGQANPGTTMRDLIKAWDAVGLAPVEEIVVRERRLREMRKAGQSYTEAQMTDGRFYAVTQQAMQNGGWVSIHQDITAQKQAEHQIAYMARHDTLTGLTNRAVMLEKMDLALARMQHHDQPFAVLMLDLDQFKIINDSLGHPVGDELLKAVAVRLRECVRQTDTIARLGGDEFAILAVLDEPTRTSAMAMAARLLEAIGTAYAIDGNQLYIGTSIGIVLAPEHGTDSSTLLKNVDLALYKAKKEGRGVFRFFEEGLGVQARKRRILQAELHRALAEPASDEFEVHYQPIVCLETRNVISCEALVRWRHPQHPMISPADFIPLAEETGLIDSLTERVLLKACREAALWPAPISVSVNLSPMQFRGAGPLDMLRHCLSASGLAPERLEVEITETVLLKGSADTVGILQELRSLGVSVVLDDFGIGYSSLGNLRMFHFDKIKIDRSFIHELSRADNAAIVVALAQLGRSLGMKTVAEGIETEEQLVMVRSAGCSNGQGYLFGRPCRASELDLSRRSVQAA